MKLMIQIELINLLSQIADLLIHHSEVLVQPIQAIKIVCSENVKLKILILHSAIFLHHTYMVLKNILIGLQMILAIVCLMALK